VTAPVPPLVHVDTGVRPITAAEFRTFQGLIHATAGIWLGDGKQALVTSRVARRVRELGLTTFSAYLERVTGEADGAERARLIEALCTHETQFFREPEQFEYLEGSLIPAWVQDAQAGLRSRALHLWSAACSSGEEAYSLAMSLLAHLPPAPVWDVEILATDLSARILRQARSGIWPIVRAAKIPPAYLRRFMRRGRGEQAGQFAAGPELRHVIRFAQVNLHEGPYPVEPRFDAIFCRNVLIYFEPEGRQRAHHHLVDRLVPGGELFLGHAETLQGGTDLVTRVRPTIYRRIAP